MKTSNPYIAKASHAWQMLTTIPLIEWYRWRSERQFFAGVQKIDALMENQRLLVERMTAVIEADDSSSEIRRVLSEQIADVRQVFDPTMFSVRVRFAKQVVGTMRWIIVTAEVAEKLRPPQFKGGVFSFLVWWQERAMMRYNRFINRVLSRVGLSEPELMSV